ncbi:hypothetical protein COV83_00680 [Candidatus Peregrinibacteria bacterium CG11_big_fil_rev_8_21_14_0_20_49_14]|nr:MAG: hypothetical protein COV83_00680 [Candidatus Peregrinibacteria bacterium CG11_big_fil_rev_8_21_14_0_20_49_14]
MCLFNTKSTAKNSPYRSGNHGKDAHNHRNSMVSEERKTRALRSKITREAETCFRWSDSLKGKESP